MIKMNTFLHELTKQYESKTLIVQRSKVKAQFSPTCTNPSNTYMFLERAGFVMKS